MILSAHQPVYLPSLHLLNKIALSDKFMFLGHCQFVNQSWHSRNQIRSGDKHIFLTVPVKKSGQFGQSINQTVPNGDHWKKKHLGSIRAAYGRSPFFKTYYPEIESIILRQHDTLAALNISLIKKFLDWLEIDTPLTYSEDFDIVGNKTDMLISLCKAVKADEYVSNIGSIVYVEEEEIRAEGITHFWHKFVHPTYQQGKKEFIPNLSVIDLLFNVGPRTRDLNRVAGSLQLEFKDWV